MVHVSLRKSLTDLLNIDGLFPAILAYISTLNESSVMSNFLQGELWKEQLKNFSESKSEYDLALPLFGYHDDVEIGNALGPHAGTNKIGVFYAVLPFLPPGLASKLISILIVDLFYANDRKKYGNEKIFCTTIDELNDLRLNPVTIIVGNISYRVYFITSLIIGDNLGLNGIFGFTESFGNTICCRCCFADPCRMQKMIREDRHLIRNLLNFEAQLKDKQLSVSGIKDECIFNRIIQFHVTQNQYLDVLHDVFEGVVSYVMAFILTVFITVDKFFTIDHLNFKLKNCQFDFESNNLPSAISLDYINANGKLKMSGAEALFFVRYFNIMVGSKIPEDNETWKLYLKLREIVCIITAPVITESHILQLEDAIAEHHSLYIFLNGDLKKKFHFMVHYPRLIRSVGPLMNCSTMRCE
uniref:Uncharacterized protein n=1 Tax=Trichogramma kaykai TaxID=54128 RepID=A0ABD2WU06_9HYME